MSFRFLTCLTAGTALVCALISTVTEAKTPTDAEKPRVTVPVTALSSPLSMMPAYHFFFPRSSGVKDTADAGGVLTDVTGISGARMGGHGLEPVIRGQQQTQLNIINDGAMIHGGCPNRMDPPTAYAPPESYDVITVLKGYQTVRYGAGGTGGTVLFERNPVPMSGETVSTKTQIGGDYHSNGKIRTGFADFAVGNALGQIRAIGTLGRGTNYKDGNGNDVRSAFRSESYSLMPVRTPNADTILKAGFEEDNMSDVLYAGMMDSPVSDSTTKRVAISRRLHDGALQKLSFSGYVSGVKHSMDNYTLRNQTGMKMRTPSESDTLGGQLTGDLSLRHLPLSLGLDLQRNERDAWSYTGMAMQSAANTLQSRLWPDALLQQIGLFAEADPHLSETTKLRVGVRYDRVTADARAADTVYGSTSADALYFGHYGTRASKRTEHNFGGLLRLETEIAPRMTMFTGISRSVRTADATERYFASYNSMASMRRVGNPLIDPEKHNQFDIGLSHQSDRSTTVISGYIDSVNDYILKDTARGQDGILVSTGATIYRNISATLMGVELENDVTLAPRWTLTTGLSYTYGNNNTDHDALGQIPPLNGKLALTYTEEDRSIGIRLNFATRQTRIDDQTAHRDIGKTAGYGTTDVYGKIKLPPCDIKLGVNNLFDKTYANHLNKSNAFDPTEVQVNEAGRSFTLSISAKF